MLRRSKGLSLAAPSHLRAPAWVPWRGPAPMCLSSNSILPGALCWVGRLVGLILGPHRLCSLPWRPRSSRPFLRPIQGRDRLDSSSRDGGHRHRKNDLPPRERARDSPRSTCDGFCRRRRGPYPARSRSCCRFDLRPRQDGGREVPRVPGNSSLLPRHRRDCAQRPGRSAAFDAKVLGRNEPVNSSAHGSRGT